MKKQVFRCDRNGTPGFQACSEQGEVGDFEVKKKEGAVQGDREKKSVEFTLSNSDSISCTFLSNTF